MKISLGCDHGGFALKEEIKQYLKSLGHVVYDCGTDSLESCDYPLFAKKAAELVQNETCEVGIVICTTGEGVCMTSNKFKNIRCGLVYNSEVAKLIKEHNNANMMAIGAKYTNFDMAKEYVDVFLNSEFLGGRHQRRVNLIENN